MITETERAALGVASRRLLNYAWNADRRDSYLIAAAIRVVVQTFDTDLQGSEALLRRAIEPEHLEHFGHEELSDLLDRPGVLIEFAPGFLADCYAAAFAHWEESMETTIMLPSRLMGLTSTRRQDYQGAWHLLQEAFPQFLDRSLVPAIASLASVTESYARHRAHDHDLEIVRFNWHGRRNELVIDGSHIWDGEGVARVDPQEQMVDQFEAHLMNLAEAGDHDAIRAVADAMAGRRLPAVLWSRVFRQAATYTDLVGRELTEVLSKKALLAARDLQFPLGTYLKAIFPQLSSEERKRIEDSVCDLPRRWPGDHRDAGERARDTYLSALSSESLVTTRAQRRKRELDQAGDGPELAPLFSMDVGWRGTYSTEDALADRGADLANPTNRQLVDDIAPLSEFANRYLNSVPPRRDSARAAARLNRVLGALQDGSQQAAEEPVLVEAWTAVASVASRLARNASDLTDAQGQAVRSAFLAAAQQPNPGADPDPDRFDANESWTPSPRIEAAGGLCVLMREPRFVDTDTRRTLDRLARDPDASVRFQVAWAANVISSSSPELCWKLVGRFARREPSASVLTALVLALGRLVHADAARALRLAETILRRELRRGDPRIKVLIAVSDLLTGHYVWQGGEQGERLLHVMEGDLFAWHEPIRHVLHRLRPALITGAAESTDASEQAIRDRALTMMRRFLQAATSLSGELRTRHPSLAGQWSEPDVTAFTNAMEVAQAVADQLFFASGVFQARHPIGHEDRHADPQQRVRLYREAHDLIQTLSRIGYPKAVHHVIELADGCIDADPRGVFLLIADAVRSAAEWGYQVEHMAQGLVVRIVRRYLAEQRQLFQDDEEMETALADILDTFVAAGWPESRRLVYGLGELFR